MFLTGISDEAGKAIETQIRAHRELGWTEMELRDVIKADGTADNLHNIPDEDFRRVEKAVKDAGLHVYCFSSRIANWGKQIDEPFDSSLEEARRAIPRMKALGTRYIRIMSFAVRKDHDDQMEQERFRRLRELKTMFEGEGLTLVHENCMNYGGMGWPFMLKLIDNVPGLKVVFDTGNPVFADDRSKPKPWPKQSAWEFYKAVRDHIIYIHIKDGVWDEAEQKTKFCFPGEGEGDVVHILHDLKKTGYTGGISIEPHMGAVYHDPNSSCPDDKQYTTYVEYGRRMQKLLGLL
jgi:sugar phosphate isomerase/epimerase